MDSTKGAPNTTPSTGAPAVTKLHKPSGRTRSLGSNNRLMYAIAAGPVAEPAVADNKRNTTIEVAFHAKTVSPANTPAKNRPNTYTFLCPYRSPIFPYAGPTTPKANIGPVMDQFKTLTDEFRSREIVSSDTTRTVMVELVVNNPARTTMRVAHLRVNPTLRAMRRGIINDHGITETSSTPPCSIAMVLRPCSTSSSSFLRGFMRRLPRVVRYLLTFAAMSFIAAVSSDTCQRSCCSTVSARSHDLMRVTSPPFTKKVSPVNAHASDAR